MKKIGFIDYFLKEWHADNYPSWIAEASKGEMKVCYGYGKIDEPNGGDTNKEWCEKMGVEHCLTIEDVIEKSDYLVILSPNNSEMHLELAQLPLRSKKPTFIDKTFATSEDEAKELFRIAKENGTPMYSSSALRYSNELDLIDTKKIDNLISVGGGEIDKYLVHQVEPVVKLMGTDILDVKLFGTKNNPTVLITYTDKRTAMITVCANADFSMQVFYDDKTTFKIDNMTEFFPNAMLDMVNFFNTSNSTVKEEETICIMKIIEIAVKQYKLL